MACKARFMTNDSPTRECNGMMTVLAFICGNYSCGIFRGTLNSFLHSAFGICAAIIAPWKWTIFNGLLTIFPPTVAILQMINFTLCHECESLLPDSLRPLLFNLTLCLGRWFAAGACRPLWRILAGARRRGLIGRSGSDNRGQVGAPKGGAATAAAVLQNKRTTASISRQIGHVVGGGDGVEAGEDFIGFGGVRVEVPAEVAEYVAVSVVGGTEEVDAVGARRPGGLSCELGRG